MTAKEYLRQYYIADRIAKRLRSEYEKELLQIDAVKSVSDLDGMPHGSGISKSVEDKAIKLADKAAAWKVAELDAIHLRQEVFNLIWDIPGLEGDILVARYIDLMTWKDVCKEIKFSWPAVRNHHAKALEIVQERLDQKKQQQVTSEM